MARTHSQTDPFKDLTWDGLQQWAGAALVSRGQRYQRSRLVQDRAQTASVGLIAWVHGSDRDCEAGTSVDSLRIALPTR